MNTSNRSESSSQRVDSRVLNVHWLLAMLCMMLRLRTSSREKNGRLAIELVGDVFGVDLGQLEQGDAATDDEETHDDGDNVDDGCVESL